MHFNLKEYDSLVTITDINQLKFSSDEQKILSFNFAPRTDHVQRIVEVKKPKTFQYLFKEIL